jgi:hypothetical protein
MLRNIPNNYDQEGMMQLIDELGFEGQYDFFFMPHDFKSRVAFGYAFVNFPCHTDALRAFAAFSGFSNWKGRSKKICEVRWSEAQGLADNVDAVRSKSVMRRNVPGALRPILIQDGVQYEIPATGTTPTTPVKK